MHSTKRWFKRAALTGLNLFLCGTLVVTGTLSPAPARSAYTAAPPPNDALLYSAKLQNLVVKDATEAVVLQATEDALSSAANTLLGTVNSGQTAIEKATVEGSGRVTMALAKTDVQVVTGAVVTYQVPLLGMSGTLTESSTGVYETNLTDKVVVTPDFTGLDKTAVRGWQLVPIDYALNSQGVSSASVTDRVSGLGITDSVNATVEVPLSLSLKGKLLDANGQPIANRTLTAQVQAPNHAYTETVTLTTGADGLFRYARREKVLVTAKGGTIATLPAPVQVGSGVTALAFWWSDDTWFDFDTLSRRFGAPQDQNAGVGDPVNLVTGNAYEMQQDLLVPGRGLSLQLVRSYNSQDDYSGPLGHGWTHSYNASLQTNTDGSVTELDPQGTRLKFTRNSDGSYTAPKGNRDTLSQAADGTYTLEKKNGVVWTFDSQGKLARIAETNGNALKFVATSGRLSKVIDTVGREVLLDYDASGRLVRVTDPAARTVQYAYDTEGNLGSVTDPLGLVTRYAYDGSHNLTQVTHPNGQHVAFTYDGQDRVTSSFADGDTRKNSLTYDKNNSRTLVRDSKGNETTFNYNDDGNITRIVDPYGAVLQYTWDADSNKVGSTDQLRNTTRLSYDARGNVTEVVDPALKTTKLAYEPRYSRLTSVTDPDAQATAYRYDAAGNLLGATDALGNQASFAYDATGQLVRATDALARTTALAYDARGNVAETTDALGNVTRTTYDILGRATTRTDALGRVTRFAYDANSRLTSVTHPDGASVQLGYDAAGHVTSVTDENGRTSTSTYDVHGRLTAQADPLGNTTRYAYDTENNLTAATDALGNQTRFEYDAIARLVRVVRPDASAIGYGYDAAGNRTQVTDPSGRVTTLSYDVNRRLSEVTDPLLGKASYLYDWAGRVTQASNPLGHAVGFQYDALGRKTREVDPLGNAWSSAYDAAGNLVRRTDAKGVATTYSYDAADRLVRTAYPDGTGVDWAYDAVGNLSSVVDATGTTSLAYDLRDRLIQETLPGARVLKHGYDPASNRLSLVDPTGDTTRFTYDAAGRMVSVSDRTALVTQYSYDALSRPTRVAYPNGTGVSYGYDALSRISNVSNTDGKGVVFARSSYSYDAVGNPVSVTDEAGGVSSLTYDALDRLTREAYPDGRTLGYTYDGAGNRLSKSDGTATTSYQYDAAERLTQAGSAAYTHDANGKLVQVSDGGTVTSYRYDAEDQLVEAGGETYRYDAFGRVASVSNGRATTSYAYDQGQLLQERDATGVAAHYTRGAGGSVINSYHQVILDNESPPLYYHVDGLGSTVGVTNRAGVVRGRYAYTAFGESRATSGTTLPPFRYLGNQVHEVSGLYDFKARWYSPSLGRFLTKDPVQALGGMTQAAHPYAYGLNNPYVYADPDGDFPPLVAAILVGAAIDGVIAGADYYLTHRNDKGGINHGEWARTVGGAAVIGGIGGGLGFGLERSLVRAAGFVGKRLGASSSLGRVGQKLEQGASCAVGKGNSFSGDTLVATESGSKPIAEVRVGERVLAYDEASGTTGTYAVTATFSHADPTTVQLTLDGEVVVTTPEHPFWGEGTGWVPAEALEAGMRVRRADGGFGLVHALALEHEPRVMYNLTVAGAHTFFVGDGQWLVHNAQVCGGGVKRGPKPFGTGPHNLRIKQIADSIKDGQIIAGGQTGLPERVIPTPGGVLSGRRPDILVRRADGSTYGINVGLQSRRTGAPIRREAEAIKDLEDAGIEMHFVPHN